MKGSIIAGLEAAVDPRANRYKVDRFNQLQGAPDVYALGDVAFMQEGKWELGHPQVAPAAIQQAELLAANLVRKAQGKPMKEFTYFDKGSMATIGRFKAVLDAGRLARCPVRRSNTSETFPPPALTTNRPGSVVLP